MGEPVKILDLARQMISLSGLEPSLNSEDGDINHSGGDLYIHLGNVSEDILKDGYKSFENGLPTSDVVENVTTTAWGRVPTNYSIVEAFDNDPNNFSENEPQSCYYKN